MVRLCEFSILIFLKLLKKATSRKKRWPGNLRLLICYLFMSTTSLTTLVYFWFILPVLVIFNITKHIIVVSIP